MPAAHAQKSGGSYALGEGEPLLLMPYPNVPTAVGDATITALMQGLARNRLYFQSFLPADPTFQFTKGMVENVGIDPTIIKGCLSFDARNLVFLRVQVDFHPQFIADSLPIHPPRFKWALCGTSYARAGASVTRRAPTGHLPLTRRKRSRSLLEGDGEP